MMRSLWYILPLLYWLSQNDYYGWNRVPKSDSELIADGITLILIVLVKIVTSSTEAKVGAA